MNEKEHSCLKRGKLSIHSLGQTCGGFAWCLYERCLHCFMFYDGKT